MPNLNDDTIWLLHNCSGEDFLYGTTPIVTWVKTYAARWIQTDSHHQRDNRYADTGPRQGYRLRPGQVRTFRAPWALPDTHCMIEAMEPALPPNWNSANIVLPLPETPAYKIVATSPEIITMGDEVMFTWLSEEFIAAFNGDIVDLSDVAGTKFSHTNATVNKLNDNKNIFVDSSGPISAFPDSFKEHAAPLIKQPITSMKLKHLYRGPANNPEPIVTICKQTPGQILSGNRIFLVKRKLNFFDHNGVVTEETVLTAAMFADILTIQKMSRSRKFFQQLMAAQRDSTELLRMIDPVAYVKAQNQTAYSIYDKYYSLSARLFTPSIVRKTKELPAWKTDAQELPLSTIRPIQLVSSIQNAPWAKARNTVKDRVNSHATKVQELKNTIAAAQAEIHNLSRHIETYARQIRDAKKARENAAKQIERTQNAVAADNMQLHPKEIALTKMQTQYQAINDHYLNELQQYIKNAEADADNANPFESMKNLGVKIIDIQYFTDGAGNLTNISDASGYKTSIKNIDAKSFVEATAQLASLHFVTTRPMIMKIINKKSVEIDQRVAGPWEVFVQKRYANSSPTIKIRLADASSIRGIKPYHEYTNTGSYYCWKVHPHTGEKEVRTNLKALAQDSASWVTDICQGELAPNLIKAFTTNNTKIIVYAMLTWLCAAYADDEWGRTYQWWPRPEDVDLDGNWAAKQQAELMNNELDFTAVGTRTVTYSYNNSRTYTIKQSKNAVQVMRSVDGSAIQKRTTIYKDTDSATNIVSHTESTLIELDFVVKSDYTIKEQIAAPDKPSFSWVGATDEATNSQSTNTDDESNEESAYVPLRNIIRNTDNA